MRGVLAAGSSAGRLRAADPTAVRTALRTLGVAAVTGVATGIVVGGLGGRLVMKTIALAAAPSTARVTANGNTVGDFTFEGTLAIVVFNGVLLGLIGGLLYLALRPWLASLGPWRGLAYGFAILALMGHGVFDPKNFDFRVFGPTGVNVALFSLLFIGFGLLIAPAFERLSGAAQHSRAAAVAWLGVVPAILVLAVGITATAASLLGQSSDTSPAFGLLVVGTLLAGALGRVIGVGRPAALALVALPVMAGGVITVTAVAQILAG